MAVKGRLVGSLWGQSSRRLVLDVGDLRPQQRDAASDLNEAGQYCA